MIDDHTDPGADPLSGRDPHPREQIDLWPLHDARQELLEEIVSQAGPGESPARTKVLLSVVGIAAALALVGGGAWAVTSGDGDGDRNDDQVAAATSDAPAPTDVATDPTTAPTTEATAEETKEPRRQDEVRKRGVRIGNIRTLRECLADIGRVESGKGRVRLEKLSRRGKDDWMVYVVRDGRRAIAIGDDCKWMRVVPEKPRR
jgi:hypothetical protein